MKILNVVKCTLVALALVGTATTMASAATVLVAAPRTGIAVQVSPGGVGFAVNNGYYYDRRHRRQAYRYPSDWQAYHHPRSWYRGHQRWDDQNHRDYYRR